MRGWGTLLGPFLVYAAHFTLLWAASIITPGAPVARVIGVVATVFALTALAWIDRRIRAHRTEDEAQGWIRTVGLLAVAVSAVSVFWQAFPAVIG